MQLRPETQKSSLRKAIAKLAATTSRLTRSKEVVEPMTPSPRVKSAIDVRTSSHRSEVKQAINEVQKELRGVRNECRATGVLANKSFEGLDDALVKLFEVTQEDRDKK